MSLLGNIIAKGVVTAARNSTIKAVGSAAANVIVAKSQSNEQKDDATVKGGKLYIKPTRSSEKYIGENAAEVAQELLGVGFNSVNLKATKKLGKHAVKKYGKICSISINGHTDFLGIKKIPASSYIIIEFYDFKENVGLEIYSKVRRVRTGIVHNIEDIECDNRVGSIAEKSAVRFCSSCGSKIANEKARFCSECGERVSE